MTFDKLVQNLTVFHVYWEDVSTLPDVEPPESCRGEQQYSQ